MRILQFGTFNEYDFSEIQGDDDWVTTRPAVTTQVGGAGGAFDFFGDTSNPPAPIIVTKGFTLSSTTYAGIATLLDTLRAATIAKPESSFLWGLPRDGAAGTINDWRFAKAKCIAGPGTPEKFEEGNYIKAPVELQFLLKEGLWYGAANTSSAAYTTGNTFQMTNSGNYPAMAEIRVTPSGSNMTSFKLAVDADLSIQPEWTFTGTVTAGTSLRVFTSTSRVTNNAVDAYADLSIGTGQVAWMWIEPGLRTFTVTFTGGSPATVTVDFNDTYLL